MAAENHLSATAVASEGCVHTRVAAASVQERIGAAFVASVDSVKHTQPPADDNDRAASVSGGVAQTLPVACNGHLSSDPSVRTHAHHEANLSIDAVDCLPSVKVVRHIMSPSTVEAAKLEAHIMSTSTVEAAELEAGCDDEAAKVCAFSSDLVDRSRTDRAATSTGAASVRRLPAESASRHESGVGAPGGKRLFDSFVDVLSIDDVTVLKWPRDMVHHTLAQPSVAYSCNPLHFDFRAGGASGTGLVPSSAADDRDVVVRLVDELVVAVCDENGTDCIAGAACPPSVCAPGRGRPLFGSTSSDEPVVTGSCPPSATGGECERQPFVAKLGCRVTARRQYRWKNRGKRTSGQTSVADGAQKNVRASTAAAAVGAGEEQPPVVGEAVQEEKRKRKKKKRKKKKKDRRHKRSRSSPKNASGAADEDRSQMGSDSGQRGGRRLEKFEKAGASSGAIPAGDIKVSANGSTVHDVKRKSRKHKSKSKRDGKLPPAFRTPEGEPGGKASGEQARGRTTHNSETGATEDKVGQRHPSPSVGYRGANGCGDGIDTHSPTMPAVEVDVKPCASDLKVKERKPRDKSALSCASVVSGHSASATELGSLLASSPAATSAAVVLPAASSSANVVAAEAAFSDIATVATSISPPASVLACHQVAGESAMSSGRPQSSVQSPLRKRSAGAQVTTGLVCEKVTAVQSPTASDREPPKKIKIAFKAAPRGGRGGAAIVEPFVVSKWDSSDGESESESERRRLRLQSVLRIADPGGSNAAAAVLESVAVGALRSAAVPDLSSAVPELTCNAPNNGAGSTPGSCRSAAPAGSCTVRSPTSKAALVADASGGALMSHPPAPAESGTSKADRDSTVGCSGQAGPSDRVPGRHERRGAVEGAISRSRSKSRSASRSRSHRRRGTSSAARSSRSRSSGSSADSRSPSRGRRSGHRRHRRRRSRSYSRSAESSSSSRERSRTSSRRSRSTRSASSDATSSSRRRRRHRPRRRTRSSSTERSPSRRSSSRSRSRSRLRSSRSRSRSRSWSRRHRRRRHRRHRSSSSRYSRSHSRTASRSRSRSRRRSRSVRRPSGRRSPLGRAVSAAFAATKKSQLLPTATRQLVLARGQARPAVTNKKPAALPAQLIKPPIVSTIATSLHQLQRRSQEGAQHAAEGGSSTEQRRSPSNVAMASSSTQSAQQGSVVGHAGTTLNLQLSSEQHVVSLSSAAGLALGLGADEVANRQTGTSLSAQCTTDSTTATVLSGSATTAAPPPFIGPLRPGERQDAPGGEGYDIPLPSEQQPTVSQGGSGEHAHPSGAGADAVATEPVAEPEVLPYDATPSEPVPMQLPPEQAEQYRSLQEQAELYRELREQQQRMREALAQGRTAAVAVSDDVSHPADQLPPPHEVVVQSYAQQMIMSQHKPSFSLPPMAAASPPLPVSLLSPAVAIHQQAAKAAAVAAAAHALPAAGGIPLQAGSPVLLAGPTPAAAAAAAFHAQIAALQQHQQQQLQQQQQQQQLAAHIQAQMHHMQAAANAAAVGGLPLHLSGHHPGLAQPAALGSGLLHGLGMHQLHGLHIGGLGAGPGSAAALAMSAGGLPQLVGPAHHVLAPNAQQLMNMGPQLVHLPFGSAMAAGGGGGPGSGPAVVMIQGTPHVLLPSRLHRGL